MPCLAIAFGKVYSLQLPFLLQMIKYKQAVSVKNAQTKLKNLETCCQ